MKQFFAGLTTAFCAIFVAWSVQAAENKPANPPTELTQLVGSDVGLCIEVRDLSGTVERFRASDMFARLKAVPALRSALKSSEFDELRKAKRQIEKQLADGTKAEQLASGLFGRSVVFAVYPNGKADPSGVMLLRATSQKSLNTALALWDRIDSGHKTTELTFEGSNYFRREPKPKVDSKKTLYYTRLGEIFVLCEDEAMIHKVLRLTKSANPLSKSLTYREARSALRGRPVLTAFLNPRAWDDSLKPPASESEVPLPLQFWRSCRWMMGSVQVDDGIIVDAVFEYEVKQLPEFWQKYVRSMNVPTPVLNRVPGNALIAIVGRFDPAMLRTLFVGTGSKPVTPKTRDARLKIRAMLAGFEVVDDLLPGLGGEFALVVVGRAVKNPSTPPFDAFLATAIAPPNANWRSRLERGLANALQFSANLSNLQQSNSAAFATVEKKQTDGITTHWISNLAGFQPAFALTPQYVVIAGSPELIRRFQTIRKDRLIDDPAFTSWQKRFFPEHSQLVFVNTDRLRTHLQQNLPAIVAWWAKSKSIDEKQAKPVLQMAGQILGVADGVFYASHFTNTRIRLTFGVVTKPEK